MSRAQEIRKMKQNFPINEANDAFEWILDILEERITNGDFSAVRINVYEASEEGRSNSLKYNGKEFCFVSPIGKFEVCLCDIINAEEGYNANYIYSEGTGYYFSIKLD